MAANYMAVNKIMRILPKELPHYETLKKLAQKYPQVDPSASEAFIYLIGMCHKLLAAGDAHFAEFGISQGRFTIIMLLLKSGDPGLSPSELAEKAGVSRATITGLVDGLERDGFIERHQAPTDRRGIVINLTGKGKSFLDHMLPTHFARIAKVMEPLNDGERAQLKGLLQKVEQGLSIFQVNANERVEQKTEA